MPKNTIKQSISPKILEAITSSPDTLKKYMSVPIMNLPITGLLLDSKEMNEIMKKEEETEYTIGNYLIKRTLGQGTFGKVKLGIYLPNKEKVAVKILEKDRIIEKDDEIRVRREFDMLAKFNHPNVILVAEIFESSNSFYSVMEYCEGGELFNYIVKNQKLGEEEAAFFYFQLINGLEYIHSLGIVHRDLKPENLLLTNEHLLKIIDFGLSNYFTNDADQKLLMTPCGSPCYASPEMVAGKKYNGFKIDIWATGIVLYAMLCGYLPFEDKNNDELFKKILECKVKYPKYMGDKSKDLLKQILVNEPEKRISISKIKEHPFFLMGKSIFEQEFSLCHNSNVEEGLKISDSNFKMKNIKEKETNELKDNINNEKLNDIENNIILTLPQEAIYKPLKTEYADKSCQFYSDIQNSEQDLNIAVEENDINEKEKVEEKSKKKHKDKNEIMNKTSNNNKKKKQKTKKETSLKKKLLRAKSKSKEFINIGNNNIIRKNKENLKKNNYRLLLTKNNNEYSKVHKTNIHLNLKKKGYSVGLTNIIKKYYNKKTIRKEKPKLNINLNNINNYIANDLAKNTVQITPSEKKTKLKSIDISKNNATPDEKRKNYLETDININKDKEKNNNKKNNTINNNPKNNGKKPKSISKKLTSEIGLNINAQNKSNKYYEDNLIIDNRRLKTEINNNKAIEKVSKTKKTNNSKNNTTVNTIHNNSNIGTSKNININDANINNQKGKIIFKKKIERKYIVDFNGHKRKINILTKQAFKNNSKIIKKTTPQTNYKKINIIDKNIDIEKTKKNNDILIKIEGNNAPENNTIINKVLKTEVDTLEKIKNKININNKIKKNHIKSSSNVNKLNNLIDQNKYNRVFNLPLDNAYGTRNIKKNISNIIGTTYCNTNANTNTNINPNINNKSYSKKHDKKTIKINTGLLLKNNNISNFSNNNNDDEKMKVNTNPNIINNNKKKILSYNNIPKNKNKKELIIRNTVINFNVLNSSLIISSLNKKRHSISNSFHFLHKKINSKKSINNSNHLAHINRTLNNATFKNYSNNIKKNKIIISNNNNEQNNNNNMAMNYSENVAKTENNETPIIKIKNKNKLEKILLNKLKQNNSQDKKHSKYNSMKIEEFHSNNNIMKKKIIKQKNNNFTKHNSNKCTTNSIFIMNKSISPTYKTIKTINNSEINSNKNLISVQKQNKMTIASQSYNGQKRIIRKMA